ncbi:integrase, catalytic region, zinc finger, CCHC-type containing protein [Tanacetum coccineum]
MLKSSPICLLSKASKTKSWLCHRRLSHLNFVTLNQFPKQGLVQGLQKMKFEKDRLCSECSQGKSKKSSHKSKADNTNQEKLYLLHMDLFGLMHVESINRKKYILLSSGFVPQLMTPRTLSSGLVPNPIPQPPYVPPIKNDWDILVLPMFDKFFNPPLSVVYPILVAAAPRQVDPTVSPMSTSIDQDAPSASNPSTQEQEQSPITSQGSSSNVRPSHTLFELLGRWTKNHPIANVIEDPSRLVSIRKKLKTDVMWCYFDAFLTSVEPNNFKEAMLESSWIKSMQEEIHEFKQLQV